MTLHAKVTAYRGFLVLQLLADRSIEDQVATALDTPGNLGHVIINTPTHLGLSLEARELLRQIPGVPDDLGDIDFFNSVKGPCFAWLGEARCIRHPQRVVAPTSHNPELQASVIPNEEPPTDLKAHVDRLIELGQQEG